MTTRKSTPAPDAAADATDATPAPKTRARKTPAKTTPARPAAKTTTARKTPAKPSTDAPATAPKKPRARKPATDWANLYSADATPAASADTTPAEATEPAADTTPARPEPPAVEMTVTPIRKLARPKRHQLSFRMPTDIPALLTEAQQITYDRGEAMSRDLIVAAAIRQWVERERAALARAKQRETEG